jgi:hypothetical protein
VFEYDPDDPVLWAFVLPLNLVSRFATALRRADPDAYHGFLATLHAMLELQSAAGPAQEATLSIPVRECSRAWVERFLAGEGLCRDLDAGFEVAHGKLAFPLRPVLGSAFGAQRVDRFTASMLHQALLAAGHVPAPAPGLGTTVHWM